MSDLYPFTTEDGGILEKVPLHLIKSLDPDALKAKIAGDESVRYGHYCDLIRTGAHANGVPIVYRTPKGTLIAAPDLRHSDLVLHAERVIRGANAMIVIKILDVPNIAGIPARRAEYLEAQR